MNMRNRQGGFTLVEVIVVAGIIAILAGILVPLILKEIDESRITRAYGDVRSISAAFIVFKKDTGKWPNLDSSCSPAVTLLTGDGVVPDNYSAVGFDDSLQIGYYAYFSGDDTGCYGSRWKGPYMTYVTSDPWGNSYLVNAKDFSGANPVWILSAGPNGTFDTVTSHQGVGGDDVGVRIK